MSKIFEKLVEQKERKKQLQDYYLVYMILFVIVSTIVFSPFIISGKSFIWKTDGLNQHYNALTYVGVWARQAIRDVWTNHTLPLWDFNIGYGSDIITTLHYYAVGDPLDLVTIVVPSEYTEYLYSTLIVVRFYLAGAAFSAYCFSRGKGRLATLAGGVAYAFCGFAIFAGVRHPYFLNPMIYLPLLLIGVERVLKEKKPVLFTLMVFVSAISNFYFFYMLVLAVVAYVFVRFFMMEHKNVWKEFVGCMLHFLLYGVIGVLMSAILLLPVILLFMNGLRTGIDILHTFFYSLRYYQRLLTMYFSASPVGEWTVLGLSAPTLLGIFVLFSKRRGRRPLKLAFLVAVAMLCIPEFGKIMNGFSYVSNRWCFVFAALVCYIMVEVWPDMMALNRKQKKFVVIASVIYYLLLVVLDMGVSETSFVGMTVLLAALILVLFGLDDIHWHYDSVYSVSICMIILVVFQVCEISHYKYDSKEENYVSEFVDRGTALASIKESSTAAMWSVLDEDEDFGRVDLGKIDVHNSSTITQVPTTQYYWSLAKGSISQYLLIDMEMCRGSSYNYKDLESRAFLEALSSVKYYINETSKKPLVPYGFEQVKTVGNYAIYENQYVLPLGYCYSGYLTRDEYDAMNAAQRQEALLQGVLLEEEALNQVTDEEEKISPTFYQKTLESEIIYGDGITVKEDGNILVTRANASLTLDFEVVKNCELYLRISGMEAEWKDRLELYQDEDESTYSHKEYDELSVSDKNKLLRDHFYNTKGQVSEFQMVAKSASVESSIYYHTPYYTWYDGRKDFLANLGYQEGERNQIILTFKTVGEYHFDDLQVICQPMDHYVEQVSALKEDVMEDIEIGTNSVTGTVNLEESKILCLTIPYDKGWTAYVDGVETPLCQANVMYMALPLKAGNHTIELHYQTYGLKIGALLSVCGFGLFVVMIIVQTQSRKNK